MKRPVQTEMTFRTWGGARKGAGRPRKGARSSEKHQRRPKLLASEPVHVVARVHRDLGSLRRRDMYKALRWATITTGLREDFRIAHLSIQGTHLHLIIEADNRLALARGLPDLGGQACQRRGLGAATRATPRCGVLRPLSRADPQVPESGEALHRVRLEQLAPPSRGPRGDRADVDRRSVFEWGRFPGMEGARTLDDLVPAAVRLRAPVRAATEDVALARGMDTTRTDRRARDSWSCRKGRPRMTNGSPSRAGGRISFT